MGGFVGRGVPFVRAGHSVRPGASWAIGVGCSRLIGLQPPAGIWLACMHGVVAGQGAAAGDIQLLLILHRKM